MRIIAKRGYCPECLQQLGILNSPQHLEQLEKAGTFPRRIGSLMWDAEQIDDWLEHVTGMRPLRADCDC